METRGEELPRTVSRQKQIVTTLPKRSFQGWFSEIAAQIPQLNGWDAAEWEPLINAYDDPQAGSIDDMIYQEEPESPEAHLAALVILKQFVPLALTKQRFGWLGKNYPDSTGRVEAWGGDFMSVDVDLDDVIVAELPDRN